MRPAIRSIAFWALVAGFVLRAVTPDGYMPAAAGSGLLFELCPDQLPAGFELSGSHTAHKHHHGESAAGQSEPDTCQLGHLLSSLATVDDADSGAVVRPDSTAIVSRFKAAAAVEDRYSPRPRAPPA